MKKIRIVSPAKSIEANATAGTNFPDPRVSTLNECHWSGKKVVDSREWWQWLWRKQSTIILGEANTNLKNAYGTMKVDKLTPASYNIFYSADIVEPDLKPLPADQVYRHHYAYSNNAQIGLDERTMKIHGFTPEIQQISDWLFAKFNIRYNMCTVKGAYEYFDPDESLKVQDNAKKTTRTIETQMPSDPIWHSIKTTKANDAPIDHANLFGR